MRTLHVPFTYPPDAPGGTELYVESLCRHLVAAGTEAIIAAPSPVNARYRHEGLEVRRFATAGLLDLQAFYGAGDPQAAAAFDRILNDVKPDVLHQHALSPACSVQLVRAAKRRGIPVVFTYHTPTVSCQRGSLLEFGRTPCDGRVEVGRCSACTLHGLGTGESASRLLARTPPVVGALLGRAGLAGGMWTALRMADLLRRRRENLAALAAEVDVFVALTPWIAGVLRLNGVPEEKIAASAHGIATPSAAYMRPVSGDGRLRVAHLGRLDPVKGTRLLIEAVRALPASAISLDIFGVVQGEGDAKYRSQLQTAAGGDERIRFRPAIEHQRVIETLSQYDVVAVPSQWLETGPLVVLEAFAAGVPVIGSSLGGVADKVEDGVNGLLVRPFNSVEAWAVALDRCAGDRRLIGRLRAGVRPPRPMSAVADDMIRLYRRFEARRDADRARPAPVAAHG